MFVGVLIMRLMFTTVILFSRPSVLRSLVIKAGAGLDIVCRMLAKGDMSNVNTIMKLSAGVIMSDSPFVENVHVLPRGHADMNMI